jgi:hypothetical protein
MAKAPFIRWVTDVDHNAVDHLTAPQDVTTGPVVYLPTNAGIAEVPAARNV